MGSRIRPITLAGVLLLVLTTPSPDHYPGDIRYTQIIQTLRSAVANDAMDFPWASRTGVTREQLCEALVHQHYEQRTAMMSQTNATWLGFEEEARAELEAACVEALTVPSGYPSPAGWRSWAGTHKGTWYAPDQLFQDEAQWALPEQVSSNVEGDHDNTMKQRVYDLQRVHWPGRTVGLYGWNLSHADVPYVWGWDPKENGDENGLIGAHLGFPFALASTQWLVWITPKTAFLEGVVVSERITQPINSQQVHGFAKASTALAGPEGAGFGQWLIVR